MLQFYDKPLMASVFALATLAATASADVADPHMAASCDLSDGYGSTTAAFTAEVSACLTAGKSVTTDDMASQVMTLTDRARAKLGEAPLAARGSLDAAAEAHALDMARRDYAAHTDPNGLTHQDRFRMLDRTAIVGAMGANVTVVNAGMGGAELYNTLRADPVNARNMDRETFTHGGFGVAEANGKLYVVQVFAQVDGELTEPVPTRLAGSTAMDVSFTGDGFEQVAWRLEDASGLRVRSGTDNDLTVRGFERGELGLEIEAKRDGVVYTLKGPMVTAEPVAGS